MEIMERPNGLGSVEDSVQYGVLAKRATLVDRIDTFGDVSPGFTGWPLVAVPTGKSFATVIGHVALDHRIGWGQCGSLGQPDSSTPGFGSGFDVPGSCHCRQFDTKHQTLDKSTAVCSRPTTGSAN